MLGMQNNFCPIPMPMNMNNISPMHPLEDPGEEGMMTEVLNIAKIKEGFYVGDKISAISIDVIIQFKITHMINATGNQIMNQWESIGISYLTLNWSESPSQILFDSKDEIANRIVEFVDGSLLGKGEGLLAHSFKGQNRVCIVVLIYLMKKYKWSLNKSMQFLKSKKQDVDIPIYFFEQLKLFENRLKSRGELGVDIPWEYEGLKDPEEKLLRNTYLNGVKFEIKKDNRNNNNNLLSSNMKINGNKNMRHIMWADNNPYQKSNLELNNSENDLFFQKNPKLVTVHQSLRPRKGCIKGFNNNNGINMNNYNMSNNSIKNVEMSMENNFANLIKKSMNLTNNIISEQTNNRNMPMELNNERNNLKIINNNNYLNQNQNQNQKNNPNNINIINNGKLNNNANNNNLNNNLNRFGQQQITKKNIVDVASSENFINKERTNNFAEANNPNDMRVNNSVNIPKSNNYMLNNNNSKNKNNNNISPFRVNNMENNNNINTNNSSAGFMNMNKNVNNNNYIKNHNMSNTQQNFYSEKQMNNIINYTPLIKDRNIREQQNQISNYNPIRGFMNGKQSNNTGNNFNKNIRNNKMKNSNNFGGNNKPLNNYDPKLIKPKGITHTDSSILNTNKNGGPIKIKNNNYINNLSKKPNTPDINHYNFNSNNYLDNNNNQNQNPNRYINTPNTNNIGNKKDIKNDTMAQGWGFHLKNNNYNRKIGSNPVRPSTAPQKDKISYTHNSTNINNAKINPSRSNQFASNNTNKNKIGRFNQRPSSAGGKSQNQGYGYVNNMNRSGNKFNKNIKTKKNNNITTGINKRLASPQMFNNGNGIGFNGNNQNNLKNKFNPAKNRMPSPVVKSNIGKRPPLPNSGQRIHLNKSEKFN